MTIMIGYYSGKS